MKFNTKWTSKALRKILRDFKQTEGTRALCTASDTFQRIWHEHFLQIRKLAINWIKKNKIPYAYVLVNSGRFDYLFHCTDLELHRKTRIEFLKAEIKRLEEKEFKKVWTVGTLKHVLKLYQQSDMRFICWASTTFAILWNTHRPKIKEVARNYLNNQKTFLFDQVSTERGKDAPLFRDDLNRPLRIEFLKYEIKRLTNAKRTKIPSKRHTRIRK